MNPLPRLLLAVLPQIAVGATLDPLVPLYLEEDQDPWTLVVGGIAAATPGARVVVSARFAGDLFVIPTVVHDGLSATAAVVLTPRKDANGTDVLTVTVAADDGSAEGSPTDRTSRSAVVTIDAVNDPPTLNRPALRTLLEDDTDPARLTVTLTGISPGLPPDEAGQQLTVLAVPVDPGLVAVESITYVQGQRTALMRLRVLPDRNGFTSILVSVFDDGLSGFGSVDVVTKVMTVSVLAQPDPPVVAARRDLVVTPGGIVPITRDDLRLEDPDGPPTSELAFVLASPPPGELRRAGAPLAPGDRFTQADIDAGMMAYRHSGGGGEAVALRYTDGTLAEPLGPVLLHAIPVGLRRAEVQLASTTAAYVEGGPAAAVDGRIEDAVDTSYLGGSLVAELTAGAAAGDRLDLAAQGSGPDEVALLGDEVRVGGQAVGILAVAADRRRLTVSFTSAAARAGTATALLRALRFSSDSRDPGAAPRTLSLVANNGTSAASDAALVTVAVTPVDDPPAVATAWVMTLPGVGARWTLAAADPDSATLSWQVVAQPAAGRVALIDAAAGVIRVEGAEVGTFPFQVAVADATSTVHATLELVVADPDAEAPLPAGDPPRTAFSGARLEHPLPFARTRGALVLALTGEAPAAAAVAVGADGVPALDWPVPSDEPTGSYRRFGVLAVDQDTRRAAHWPFIVLVHPQPRGVR